MPPLALGAIVPPPIGKANVGGSGAVSIVGATVSIPTFTLASFVSVGRLVTSDALLPGSTVTVFGCVSLNAGPRALPPLNGALLFCLPVKPSFLLSCLAPLPVIFIVPAVTVAPKPLRATLTPLTGASFMLLPATFALSALVFVSRTITLATALFLPCLNLMPALCSMVPLPLVGSREPPLTGRVTLRPLTVPGLTLITLTPAFFSFLRRFLL